MWIDADCLSIVLSFLQFFDTLAVLRVCSRWNVVMRSAKWESKIVPVALHNGTIPLMAEHRRWVHFTEWSSKEKVRQMLSFCCSRQTNVAFLIGIRGLHIGRGIFCTLNTPVEIYLFKVASKLPDLGHRLKCVHVDEISFQHARRTIHHSCSH